MKLSIIIPVYNAECFLTRCLDAVLNQNMSDYEVIVVNDGSQDNSFGIIERYASENPDILKVLNVDNGGQGRARNLALDIAQGDYIGFVDADDYPGEEMFSKLLSKAEAEKADIVVCDWNRFEGDHVYYESYKSAENPLSSSGAVWNKLYKRSLIDGIRFPQGLWYEDFSFSAKMLIKSQKTVYLHEPLYYYRADNPSTMRNSNAIKNLDMIQIMEDIRNSIKEDEIESFYFLLINNVLLDSINRVASQNSNKSDKKYVINQFLNYIHSYIPNLFRCKSYCRENSKRKLIMLLNYNNMYRFSNFILSLKKSAV